MLKGTRHRACEKTGKLLLFSLGIMSDTVLQAAAANCLSVIMNKKFWPRHGTHTITGVCRFEEAPEVLVVAVAG